MSQLPVTDNISAKPTFLEQREILRASIANLNVIFNILEYIKRLIFYEGNYLLCRCLFIIAGHHIIITIGVLDTVLLTTGRNGFIRPSSLSFSLLNQ